MSAATRRGLAFASATTSVSDGPKMPSMPTSPNRRFLASVTKMLPGPQILSTRGTLSVPYASAAMPCTPPARKTRSTPAMAAATSFSGATEPSSRAGVTMTSSETPGDSRRDRRHQQRRGVDHLVAGHVQADALDGAHDLAEATVLERVSGVLQLHRVVIADALRGDVERLDQRDVHLLARGLDLLAGDFEREVGADAVDLLVVAADGCVAVAPGRRAGCGRRPQTRPAQRRTHGGSSRGQPAAAPARRTERAAAACDRPRRRRGLCACEVLPHDAHRGVGGVAHHFVDALAAQVTQRLVDQVGQRLRRSRRNRLRCRRRSAGGAGGRARGSGPSPAATARTP